MKKLFLCALAACAIISSCQDKNGYVIKGTIEGVADGDSVLLQDFNESGFVKEAAAIVKRGTFEFKGTPKDITESRFVTYQNGKNSMTAMVFIEKGVISLHMKPEENQVSGTECNDAYQKFINMFIEMNKELQALYVQSEDSTLTDAKRAELKQQMEKKNDLATEQLYASIRDNIKNLMGIQLLASYADAFDRKKVSVLVDQIPEAYRSNPEVVELIKKMSEPEAPEIGDEYIDFTMKTPEGKELRLSDVVKANKYVLVDFWASWCGPCRAEMPNVVKAYEMFRKKGLEIVGVSLDESEEAWTLATKELRMPWLQVSDLKGWNNAAAALYGIHSIPATLLISNEGKIVNKNLRGDKLISELSELLSAKH